MVHKQDSSIAAAGGLKIACTKPPPAANHLAKIIALAEVYGDQAVARALDDGLAFHAFSSDYIANILQARERKLPEPGPLQLTRRADLLDIELAEPDLSPYEVNDHEAEDDQS